MTRPSNRAIVALIAVCGVAGVLAIVYTGVGTNSLLANALRITLVTLTVLLAGRAIVLRELRPLVMIAGLAAWSVDTFYPHSALVYGGIALYLGGFYLLRRQLRAPHTTGP
jgi:hypothetical protein